MTRKIPVARMAFRRLCPGSKMATAGADWQTSPTTQIEWGLGYIKSVYGTPCAAWNFELANNYY